MSKNNSKFEKRKLSQENKKRKRELKKNNKDKVSELETIFSSLRDFLQSDMSLTIPHDTSNKEKIKILTKAVLVLRRQKIEKDKQKKEENGTGIK